MNTPSITPAQYVAIVQPILATLVAFGAPISDAQQTAIVGMASSFSMVLVIADAIIRRARANNAGAIAAAKVAVAQIEDAPARAYVPGE